MIHPRTKVHWLDTNKGENTESGIADLFRAYALLLKIPTTTAYDKNRGVIEARVEFPDDINVVVKDLFGWTAVSSIVKKAYDDDWLHVQIYDHVIDVTHNTLIPVYTYIDSPMTGFHGELKYPLELKEAHELRIGDLIRIRKGDGDAIIPVDHINRVPGPKVGYEMITKSGFTSFNQIHLFTGEINSDILSKIHYK